MQIRVWLAALVVTAVLVAGASAATGPLPGHGDLTGWSAEGPVQKAHGAEDLFRLIDGGAEIYVEYGFRQAWLQNYKSASGRTMVLEIYRMKDPAGAYGVFTFKAGDNPPAAVGQGGIEGSYWLTFWKGPYLVTVVGGDEEKETRRGVKRLAEIVAANIREKGEKPRLAQTIEALHPQRMTFFRGGLGLNMHREIGPPKIYGVKTGVVAEWKQYKTFIFQYENPASSKENLARALQVLEKSGRFENIQKSGGSVNMLAPQGRFLRFMSHGRYMVAVVEQKKGAADETVKRLKKALGHP